MVCAAVGCHAGGQKVPAGRTFSFPHKNPKLLAEWVRRVGRKNFVPGKTAFLCQRHFAPEMFVPQEENVDSRGKHRIKIRLIEGAIPTLFCDKDGVMPIPKQRPLNANAKSSKSVVGTYSVPGSQPVADQDHGYALSDCRPTPVEQEQQSEIGRLKKENERLSVLLNKTFNQDQLQALDPEAKRVGAWSDETLKKAIAKLLMCGQTGYEHCRSEGEPLPALRTLQWHLAKIKFEPGLLEDMFVLLSQEVKRMEQIEKYCCLMIDEMAIKPCLEYDQTTQSLMGSPTLVSSSANVSDALATHALAFVLGSCSQRRWKMLVAYEFTGKSFCAREVVSLLGRIIQRSSQIGLFVKSLSMDMGPCNQAI